MLVLYQNSGSTSAKNLQTIFFLLVLLLGTREVTNQTDEEDVIWSPRDVVTKWGVVRGVLVRPPGTLYPVETFLAIPYAASPVNELRFAPPATPSPWNGVFLANQFSPVCPQAWPNASDEEILKTMPKGRLERLRRIIPLLKNQSENCLYLNVYIPFIQGKITLSVLSSYGI